jgi:hypothetical protein
MSLFVPRIGISPLSVVQETIVVHHFASSSHSSGKPRVAKTVALALLLGKLVSGQMFLPRATRANDCIFQSSFIGFLFAPSLSSISRSAPYFTSTALSLVSLAFGLSYYFLSRHLPESQVRDEKHSRGELVTLEELSGFRDAFWWYAMVCVFSGATWLVEVPWSS